jgi:2,4-dienoyl-CoA reductase-like NADH-dependent reductase (Old Yellow Enzyme family)
VQRALPATAELDARPVAGKVARGARAFGYDEEGNPGFLDTSTPRQLATDEIGRVVEDFVIAAQNARDAGFDGVELHGASDYLIEQFLNPNVNDRNGRYSSQPLANRLRFTLEVIDAVSAQIGAKRVGIRFTPYGQLFDMPASAGTERTYLEPGRELAKRQIAYIHLMDQSGFRLEDRVLAENTHFKRTLEKLRQVFDTGALILAGAQTRFSCEEPVLRRHTPAFG